MLFRRPFEAALSIAVALSQIGEFSFILGALGRSLKILPESAIGAMVVASIASITINPLLYKTVKPTVRWLKKRKLIGRVSVAPDAEKVIAHDSGPRVIVVGYGPV